MEVKLLTIIHQKVINVCIYISNIKLQLNYGYDNPTEKGVVVTLNKLDP